MMRMKQPARQVFRRSLLRTLSLLLAVPLLCAFALTGLGTDVIAKSGPQVVVIGYCDSTLDRPPRRPPRRPSSEAVSAFADGEYDFWKAVRRRILNADSGDIIRVQARRYNKFPEIVMRALRLRTSVSLLIEWNGGDDIFIPAGEALYDDGTSLFWTLRQLEKIYGDSGQVPAPADPPKPETKPEPAPSTPTVTETKPSAGTGGFSPGADALPAAAGAETLPPPAAGVMVAEPSVTNPPAAPIAPIVPIVPAVEAADVSERPSAVSEPVRQTQAEGRSTRAIVTGGTPSVLPSETKTDELPEALVMTVALLAVLALCGVFTGAWLFSRKGQIRR